MVIRFHAGTFVLINALYVDGMTGEPMTMDVNLKQNKNSKFAGFLFFIISHCSRCALSLKS